MGMFDSMYDTEGHEWQTKAYGRILERWEVGHQMRDVGAGTYQVQVLGGPLEPPFAYSLATIRDGRLVAVPAERDESMPLLDYWGDWITKEGATDE